VSRVHGHYEPGSVLRDPRVYLSILPDHDIRRPLWEFAPHERLALLHERRVRGLESDPEPIGDPEFS
jgi:hypothetical protein